MSGSACWTWAGLSVIACSISNINSDFDFAEAVRNLRRLDGTLLGSAMAHTPAGISAMALPRDVAQVRALSPADSLSLFERLRQHYGFLVTDAGGFSKPLFFRPDSPSIRHGIESFRSPMRARPCV